MTRPIFIWEAPPIQVRIYWGNWLSVLTAYFILPDQCAATWQRRFFWYGWTLALRRQNTRTRLWLQSHFKSRREAYHD